MERERGLALRELIVATAIVLLVAAVAVPDAMNRRIEANETTAVAALEAIRAAQERFKAARVVDVDQDGVGEYGLMRELTRAMCARSDALGAECGGHTDVPLLDATFLNPVRVDYGWFVDLPGEVMRSGYLFHVLLPRFGGDAVQETWEGPLERPIDTDLAETMWCCYAWPESYGDSGRRAFFTNQTGTIVSADFPLYSGTGSLGTEDGVGSALLANGDPSSIYEMTGDIAVNAVGRDAGYWTLVTPRVSNGWFRIRRDPHWNGGGRGRVTSASIRARQTPTASIETLDCRATGLRPGVSYAVTLLTRDAYPLHDYPAATLGRATATSSGQLSFRFDTRKKPLPDGVTTLADFEDGWLELQRERDPFDDHGVACRLGSIIVDGRSPSGPSDIAENEAAAISALREIAVAQTQFAAGAYVDLNTDGVGEFGLLRELSGGVAVRWDAIASSLRTVLRPPLLPPDFATFDANSDVSRSGYLFHMMLPSWGGAGVAEVATGALAAPIDSDLAETTWCCYAWPVKYGVTGKRTYFINQEGAVTTTESVWYSGSGALGTAGNAGAAFRAGWLATGITGQVAIAGTGRDGYYWRPVAEHPDERDCSVTGTLASPVGDRKATGEFTIASHLLRTVTDEPMWVSASPLSPDGTYRVVLTNESGDFRFDAGAMEQSWYVPTGFGLRYAVRPEAIASWSVFSGGTIEVLDDADTVVLRGAIPHFATLDGPADAGASLSYHAAVPLTPGPHLRLKRGLLDVSATSDSDGARQEMTLSVTTFDRLARRADVVAISGDVETPLGTIHLHGDRGAGVLVLDTSRGEAMPGGSFTTLAGQRIEVRDPTGAVLLTGTFPDAR